MLNNGVIHQNKFVFNHFHFSLKMETKIQTLISRLFLLAQEGLTTQNDPLKHLFSVVLLKKI